MKKIALIMLAGMLSFLPLAGQVKVDVKKKVVNETDYRADKRRVEFVKF